MDYAKWVALLKKQKTATLSMDEQNTFNEMKNANPSLDKIWEMAGQYEPSFQPDLERGLSRLKSRIREEKQLTPQSSPTLIYRSIRTWAAVAAVLLLAAFAWYLIPQSPSMVYETASGEVIEFELMDGSRITLNENSKLTLVDNFNNGNRATVLEGHAYFDIAPDAKYPFSIKTEKTVVEVLGTAFTLRAYPKEDSTLVEVTHGKVAFSDQVNNLTLKANMKGVCLHAIKDMKAKQVDEITEPKWYKTRAVNYRNTSFEIVKEEIEKRFNIEIIYDPNILSATCTLNFPIAQDAKKETVLKQLELALSCSLEATGKKKYELIGGECYNN